MLVKLARNWASPEAFYRADKGPHEMPDKYLPILPRDAEVADGPMPAGPKFRPVRPAGEAKNVAPKPAAVSHAVGAGAASKPTSPQSAKDDDEEE